MNYFENFIRCSCKIDVVDNKKYLSGLMKNWINIEVSHYNSEDNFMILTGLKNGITVIDLDISKHESDTNSITWFEEHIGRLSDINTLVTQTISGGYHIYFKYCADLKTTTKLNGIPLDILNDNKGVLEGKGYTVVNNCDIRALSVDELIYFKPTSKEVLEITNSQSHSELQMRKILNGLSLTRFDERDSWIRIGYILSQYTFGENLFKEFSKKSSKYDETTHDQQWNSLNSESSDTTVTIATLLMWLKTDNHTLFEIVNNEQKIIQELNNSVIKTNYKITSNEVIKMKNNSIDLLCDYDTMALLQLHTMGSKKCKDCDLQGIYTNSGFLMKCTNCTFSYPDTPIIIPKTDNSMIYNILNQICINNEDIKNKDTLQVCNYLLNIWKDSIYYDEFNKIWYVYNEYNGLYTNKTDNNIIKRIDETIVKEQQNGLSETFFEWTSKIEYKKQLLQEIKTKFDNIDEINMDGNGDLLGFKNGVYNLNTSIFDKGNKEDFVSLSVKYDYDINTNIDVAQKLLSDYFPIKDDYNYVLDLLCLSLEGRNRTQTFTICYGFSASNGKSFLMERLSNIFNNYANTFPVNMITNKMREAGNANVDLINFKQKRFMYCSEPEANCKFNTNFLKQLTGDTITARKNHSNELEKIKPTYNMFICCNRLPGFDIYDEGISRRIRIIEFKNKFVDKPKLKTDRQRKNYSEIEIDLIEKSLLHLLIENYKVLRNNQFEIKEPGYLKLLRESYGDSNNEIKEVLDNHIQKSENQDDYITKKDIKQILKENKIKIQDVDLTRLIESLYECTYYNDLTIKLIRYQRIFKGISLIADPVL
jgi:phage/plasmid-associated DNA primase